jgi:spermidine synthase
MSKAMRQVCFSKSRYIIYQPYVGLHLAYHARKFYFSQRSRYQKIDIIDNDAYGRMLFLDDNLQHTSYDSRVFNEALCTPAIRNQVQNVLILGGGSGQTAMTMLESPATRKVTIVEIDKLLVECCKKYVKGTGHAFTDPRLRVIIKDAFKYIHATREEFDVAIIDLTERPFGFNQDVGALKRLYRDIRQKCKGQCSQYVGSSIRLAYDPRTRHLTESVSKHILSRVRYEDVFIPSFGAPHTFMHAGYRA